MLGQSIIKGALPMTKSTVLLISLFFASTLRSEILFEVDFEGGTIPYRGYDNRNSNQFYFSWLGGLVTGNPSDGRGDPDTVRNVVISNELHAQGSIMNDSEYALKTHYASGLQEAPNIGYNNSFLKNTTIIRFPEINSGTIHIRWSQKWHPDWEWPSDHHKLLKLRNSRDSQSPSQNLGKMQTNDQDNVGPVTNVISYGGTSATGFRQVFANLFNWVPSDSSNVEDGINNELGSGRTDINFNPEVGRWYTIEVMMQFDSAPAAGDGEYKLWVDGNLYIHVTNADIRPAGDTTGVDTIELQHVRERAQVTAVDMPTYMDNIAIGTEYIGLPCPTCPGPPDTIGVSQD